VKVFCFPWSGASENAYRPLTEALPQVDIMTVRPPRTTSLHAAAAAIAEEMPEGRCVLFGHSYGALLAYAVTQLLETPPELLIVSGSRSPATPPPVTLHQLDDQDLDDRLAKLGGMRSSLLTDRHFMARFRPRVRADLALCESYRATARVDVPLSVWAGRSDWYATPFLTRQWRRFAGDNYRFRLFDGGHFFVTDTARSAAALLADLHWASTSLVRSA
jgi:medium-chain acyl-[acyl-carrier-protein] hydrolase